MVLSSLALLSPLSCSLPGLSNTQQALFSDPLLVLEALWSTESHTVRRAGNKGNVQPECCAQARMLGGIPVLLHPLSSSRFFSEEENQKRVGSHLCKLTRVSSP